jgi:hypothetical protein
MLENEGAALGALLAAARRRCAAPFCHAFTTRR